jgi:predicted metal-dependent hydrolase
MSQATTEEFICSDGTRLAVVVRSSAKAQHRRLSLSHQGTLEVVIPARSVPSTWDVVGYLESNRRWIERATARTSPQREAYQESLRAGLPTHLDFPLASELWLVEYRPTQASSVTIKPAGLRWVEANRQVFALTISGAVDDQELVRLALIRFTTKRAKQVIPPFAWEVCREIGAQPTSITVNNRKSAWGVCTRTGDIRIDRRVAFLPRDLARQIVLHEAAHLRHLNHSQRFYDELYSYQGSSKEAEKSVKKAISFIPAWFIDGVS